MPKISLHLLPMVVLGAASLHAQEVELSLDDLLNIRVESVSKREEPLAWAPSAVFVLKGDDLRRQNVRRLQDALRMVPGFFSTDQNWQISAVNIREEKSPLPTTMNLVIDGVPMNNQSSGAPSFIDYDIPVEVIDRIEVIRGPGGTVYGANSVTGIITVFTKKPTGEKSLLVRGESEYPGNYRGVVVGGGQNLGGNWTAWAEASRSRGYGKDKDTDKDSIYKFFKGKAGVDRNTGMPMVWNDTLMKIQNRFHDPDNGLTHRWSGGLTSRWSIPNVDLTLHVRDNGEYDKRYTRIPGEFLTEAQATRKALYALGIQNPDSLIGIYTPAGIPVALMGMGFTQDQVKQYFMIRAYLSYKPDSNQPINAYANVFVTSLRSDFNFSEKHKAFANLSLISLDQLDTDYSPDHDVYNAEVQDILDIPLTDSLRLEWISGVDYRMVKYHMGAYRPAAKVRILEPNATEHLYSGFVQGKLSYADLADVIAGTKAEVWTLMSNTPTWQPSVRASFHPSEYISIWGAYSKAVTVPGIGQTRLEYPLYPNTPNYVNPFAPPSTTANDYVSVIQSSTKPATYRTKEAGARGVLTSWLSYDLAAYLTEFSGRVSQGIGDTTPVPSKAYPGDTVVPRRYQNMDNGGFWGTEAVLRILPIKGVLVEGSYTWSQNEVYTSLDTLRVGKSQTTPQHQFKARIAFDNLPYNIKVSSSITVNSSYRFESKTYDWALQTSGDSFDPFALNRTTDRLNAVTRPPRLDLDVQIPIVADRVSVGLWGHNMLAAGNERTEDVVYASGVMRPQLNGAQWGGSLQANF